MTHPGKIRGGRFSLVIPRIAVTTNFVMTEVVTFFRAVGDDTRWRIVRLVMDRALCVCELADILEMPQSTVSSHVQIIRRAGMLESESCGKWTYFRIGRPFLVPLKAILKQFPDSGIHADDRSRAEVRLARRDTSCCQGPVTLARPRKPSVVTI